MRGSSSPAGRRGVLFLIALGGLLLLTIAACQATALAPPRLANATAQSAQVVAPTKTPLFLPAPTPTEGGAPGIATPPQDPGQIEVWVNETSQEHENALQSMSDAFTDQSGISVSVRLISPRLLPELVNTAVLSDTLPDIIVHPVEYTMGWSERGILDAAAANNLIDRIGRESFDPAALALVNDAGATAALPSDGAYQIWLYRTDWASEQGLSVPDNFTEMLQVAEAFFDPEGITSGLVVPTESNLVNTQRAFEQIALANGCQLIDGAGEVQLFASQCGQALDFYFEIIHNFSPTGVQTDISARNAFLEGRTGMIMTSPSILPQLSEAGELDQNSGIVTSIRGNGPQSQDASFSNLTYVGITSVADQAAAAEFLDYWFNEGYDTWLGANAERKVPLRWGNEADSRRFIDQWGSTPIFEGQSLADIYGPDTVAQLRDGVASGSRWGLPQGQGSLLTELYEDLTLSVVLQEMLSGYFGSEQTLFEAANRVIGLIPDYGFEIVPTPTPVPEDGS